jgi:tetracycline repressor-like protein
LLFNEQTGSRVNAWFANWLTLIGSRDPSHDVHVLGNYLTGLMLHQLAVPDPGFDPADKVTALLESLVHGQDIALPLGPLATPGGLAVIAATGCPR